MYVHIYNTCTCISYFTILPCGPMTSIHPMYVASNLLYCSGNKIKVMNNQYIVYMYMYMYIKNRQFLHARCTCTCTVYTCMSIKCHHTVQ